MAIPFRSGNPALKADTFSLAPALHESERMTLGGTANKTLTCRLSSDQSLLENGAGYR